MLSKLNSLLLRFLMLAIITISLPSMLTALKVTVNGGEAHAEEKKKRRYPALRARAFSQLERAQNLADKGEVTEGLQVLKDLERRIDQLNSYEKAMVYNFMAYIHYGEEQVNQAVLSFKKVLEQDPIPESLEQSTLYSLAQLQMHQEKYDAAIDYIRRWSKLSSDGKSAQSESLLANAYYAKKDYKKALGHINESIRLDKEAGKVSSENLLILKRAVHYELKQPEQITLVTEDLVRHYSKPKYWVELANMYGETGQNKKQMAVMEAAHQQGFVTAESDLKNLAQLYYLNGAPFKAGQVMKQAIESGAMSSSLKNLEFLAQAWMVAKEFDRAVPVLEKAAVSSTSGDPYARLAEIYVNTENWTKAIEMGQKALEKGQLTDINTVYMALGMAHFNLQQFDLSTQKFQIAARNDKFAKMANQWISYVSKEKEKRQRLLVELGQEIDQL